MSDKCVEMSENANKMRDRLINGEPICDYTKTDWNDCCECSAKDYCDKYNERSEIIREMLGEVIGEIKNEGR